MTTTQEYFEKKFFVPTNSYERLSALISHYFIPLDKFSVGTNFTTYFDTSDFVDYSAGLNGSYYRKKVRIRTYENSEKVKTSPVSYEVKEKIGSTTIKKKHQVIVKDLPSVLRQPDELPQSKTFQNSLKSDFIQRRPILSLSYRRRRFICPQTGTRVNLDTNMKLFEFWPERGFKIFRNICTKTIVLEIKGSNSPILPAPLADMNIRGFAFSKYCFFLSNILDQYKICPKLDYSSDLNRPEGWHF